jgi:hypothetical protein
VSVTELNSIAINGSGRMSSNRKRSNGDFYCVEGPLLLQGRSKKAQKRPGQQPPAEPGVASAAAAAQRGQLAEDLGDLGLDAEQATANTAQQGEDGTTWQERKQREAGKWEVYEVHARKSLLSQHRMLSCFKSCDDMLEQQRVQQRLDQTWRSHQCSRSGQAGQQLVHMENRPADIECVETRDVEYISTTCRVTVKLPHWHCNHCQSSFAADLISAACWPSTPTLPSFLYSLPLMHSYASAQRAGYTMTGES